MPPLPSFSFRSSGLPSDQAFEEWRKLMSQVFTIEQNPLVAHRPRGDLACYVLGDIMASQLAFNAQRMTRRKALVDTTPDHLTFQVYHSGGFVGEIAGQSATLRRGLVVVSDMRYQLEASALASNTTGLSIPHRLLDGLDLRRPLPVLDAERNRLLAARIVALHRALPGMDIDGVPAVTAELVSFLRRLFDPSSAPDVLDGSELDAGVRAVAERVIARELGSPKLSPATIAEKAHVSRASLYRAFTPDSIMDYIRRARLDAVYRVLQDPADRRNLAEIAADHGFSSLTLLGRSFRAQFGLSPRDARVAASHWRVSSQAPAVDLYMQWWRSLGLR